MLGTASAQREAALPQVPTMEESGLPDFRLQIFFGVAAPAKTPPALVERLDQEIKAVTDMPEVQERMAKVGFDSGYAGQRRRSASRWPPTTSATARSSAPPASSRIEMMTCRSRSSAAASPV